MGYSQTGALPNESDTSILFDAATTKASRVAAGTFAFPNTTFTIEGWVNTPTPNTAVFASGGSTGTGGWSILVNGGGGVSVILKNALNNFISRASVALVTGGAWHYIAIVIRTDTAVELNSDIQIYINGTLSQGAIAYPGTGAYQDPGINYSVSLGARGVPLGASNFYGGRLDEVAIYNYGVSAAQIAAHYAHRVS